MSTYEVDMDIDGVADDDEEDPGGYVCVNDDDDNGNGIPDNEESGTVSGEDDLVAIYLSCDPSTMDGYVRLSSYGAAIKVWSSSTKGNEILSGAEDSVFWPVSRVSSWSPVYVEGCSAGYAELCLEFTPDCQNWPGGPDSVNFTVVGVYQVKICANDIWSIVSGESITLLKGTKYTFSVSPNPEQAAWPSGTPVWKLNGDTIASGTDTTEVIFDSEGTQELRVMCASDGETGGKTVTIEVIVPQPDQVSFVGNVAGEEHSIYNVTDPVWEREDNPDDPASYTMNKNVKTEGKFWASDTLTYSTAVHVDVEATGGFTFSEDTSVDFGAGWGSWPSEATDHVSDDTLANSIGTTNLTFTWKYKVPTGTNEWITMANTSGPHKIYRVYDEPECEASNYTEGHLDWACDEASGQTTDEEIADAIQSALNTDPPMEPGQCDPCEVSDDWDLLDGCPYYGECDEQAKLMARICKLLGITASQDWVYPSTDTNCDSQETRNCGTHGDEYLRGYYSGFWNNFEGVCATVGKYYAVWPKIKDSTKVGILRIWLASPNYQGWRYWDGVDEEWKLCETEALP